MTQDLMEKPAVQSFDPSRDNVSQGRNQSTGGAGCGSEQKGRSNHWEVRTQEQPYAFLPEQPIADKNRYGQLIDLVDLTGLPKERSLFINENPEVGSNPNRNKQHGFFFTADNCIGCHACEAACSEKNENPAHIAFRSVGYVEGGSYPDYKRMNISMACNHCDDPVCLKGCPTRAYTKHAEYGAVLQDPDTCFGCGYCTWVCPYNAPQLDPVKGQVSKCNMCVDRLEVGLKPACVSACVGNALDFGVIENTPENRQQCKTDIPGFPSPDITHPNIRFQQTKSMPLELTRTDSMPVKYHRDEEGSYKPAIDQKAGKAKHWNFGRLNSRENPLVIFTLSAQAAYGMFLITIVSALAGVTGFSEFVTSDMFALIAFGAAGLTGLGLLMSVTHLGKPFRAYRGFNNLRHSPVSREGLGLALFKAGCGITGLLSLPYNSWFMGLFGSEAYVSEGIATPVVAAALFAIIAGFGGLFYMNKCYQIKARPFWNHLQTTTSFAGNSLSLGSLVSAIIVLPTLALSDIAIDSAITALGSTFALGLILEAIGLWKHNKDLNRSENEGGAAHYVQCTTFGKTYLLRNTVLAVNLLLAIGLLALHVAEMAPTTLLVAAWVAVAIASVLVALVSRALFYILVIPTTMPGAFFWKNKGFEQHARDIGLADNPNSGVVHLHH
jgi:DMSO reductase iron-sulfur subunit